MTDDANATPKKRMGRPPKPTTEVKRHGVAFRVNDRLREQIQKSAEQNQRSVAEEVEYRLQVSATIGPLVEEMTSDKVSQDLFRTIAKALKHVRNIAKRANYDEIQTRAALKRAFDHIGEVNFWTGGEAPPVPEGYIGSMDQPPRRKHEMPPEAMGYSVASDILLSDMVWEDCKVAEDYPESIRDYWSGDGTKFVDVDPVQEIDVPPRSLESIMDEVNPRDRKSRSRP